MSLSVDQYANARSIAKDAIRSSILIVLRGGRSSGRLKINVGSLAFSANRARSDHVGSKIIHIERGFSGAMLFARVSAPPPSYLYRPSLFSSSLSLVLANPAAVSGRYTASVSFVCIRACICQKFQLNFIGGIAIESHAESSAGYKPPFPRFIRPRLQVKVARGRPGGIEIRRGDRAETRRKIGISRGRKFFERAAAVILGSSARFRLRGTSGIVDSGFSFFFSLPLSVLFFFSGGKRPT